MRFPVRAAVLLRFGRMADAAALALAPKEGPHRDRLFDLLMRRMDVLQAHRAGVLALMRALPTDPCLTALLAACEPAQHGLDAGRGGDFRPRTARAAADEGAAGRLAAGVAGLARGRQR